MPKTNAEWQALDDRLAREVMGWCGWDDIPESDRNELREPLDGGFDYLAAGFSVSEYEAFSVATHRAFWWQKHPEHGWDHAYDCRDWQPHEDVAQALGVLDAIISRGFDADLRILYHDPKHQAWIRPADFSFGACMGRHIERAKAICLAAERWANAQKEKPLNVGLTA